MPAQTLRNPIVFMDMSVGQDPVGRILIELFEDECPKTVENFRSLCTGERVNDLSGRQLTYKSSVIHAVYPGWAIVGGDIINGNGTSGESIYGPYFEDESYAVKHDSRGTVSMMNFKNDTNNSQFLITMCPAPSLDGQNVAFGRIIDGESVLDKIQEIGSMSGATSLRVSVAECGQLPAHSTAELRSTA